MCINWSNSKTLRDKNKLKSYRLFVKLIKNSQTNNLKKIQEKLKQRKRDLAEEVETEIEEQRELRDHEEDVLNNIMTQQATLSDSERDSLLKAQKEHLANMEHRCFI